MDAIKLVHSIIEVAESKLQSKSLGQVTTFIRKIGAFSNGQWHSSNYPKSKNGYNKLVHLIIKVSS